MSQALILGVAAVGGLACPLHMWWSNRRGRRAVCCPADKPPADGEIGLLRARQELLRSLIAQHESVRSGSAEEAHSSAKRR